MCDAVDRWGDHLYTTVYTRPWWRPWRKTYWLRCWWCNLKVVDPCEPL